MYAILVRHRPPTAKASASSSPTYRKVATGPGTSTRPRPSYWHRFFSHQPDLNFDHPRVMQEVLTAMRFWLDMGVDALRLDAILPRRARRRPPAKTSPRPTKRSKKFAPSSTPSTRIASFWRKPTCGRRSPLLRLGRRVPHGFPFPTDAAHLHAGSPPGRPPPHHRYHSANARDPRPLPVGTLPAAPTNSPSRWSPTASATTCTSPTPPIRACVST